MNRPLAPHDIARSRRETDIAQGRAADPASSVWVSANAGTGKTHVLTNRVLRLLLEGTPPARILCLTYTKAAAAEMSKRVFDKLAAWVTASDEELTALLTALIGAAPSEELTARARTLFTTAIETPGGLKVQTIHAFAERLLQRFPLEAGVPPGFRILDDAKKRELLTRAIDATISEATARPAGVLNGALEGVIRYASDHSFDELLTKMVSHADWLRAASRLAEGRHADDFAQAEALLRVSLGVGAGRDRASLERDAAAVMRESDLSTLRDHLSGGGPKDQALAQRVSEALQASGAGTRVNELAHYFFDSKGEPRAKLMSKGLSEARPDLHASASSAQLRFAALMNELKALTAVEATVALYRLAGSVLQRYTDAKAAAGALDFDDLIARTISLLSSSNQADWVLFKLDGGLDHILVDEAQDTSPQQWQIISALAREFFSGSGAREDVVRTLFAVGDEKQSIYSFQGAEPERFREMGASFASLASQARGSWQAVPLNLSFRTVQPVLDAVDRVFADPARTPGLTSAAQEIRHIASRHGAAGLVELWPLETMADQAEADPWEPLADTAERAPANRLAERIAATIAHWMASGEVLPSTGKAITPGDVLILVRKRNPFAVPMVAALKARGIPVAGSDRVHLSEQVAVRDLMALGDFLTLPEDDLALASVLKSPLFNLNDADLTEIAPGRKGALWKAFLAHADTNLMYRGAAETLKKWRAKADFVPPFEFFSHLLERDGARSAFLHRLGPEAADAIDEFLELALNYDDGEPPSLTGFLASLREAGHEVKRDMEHGRDEVRVMTVHGAKGLEAPIVILPDTCTTASGDGPGLRLLKLTRAKRPPGVPDPVVWVVKGTSKLPQLRDAATGAQERETAERNRLLYVAMTRARDRLYVAGFEGRKKRPADCWYDLIADALRPMMQPAGTPSGTVLRLETAQTGERDPPPSSNLSQQAPVPLPAFALKRAAAEPLLAVPLAPSRLEPYAPDAEGEPALRREPGPGDTHDRPSPLHLADGNRFLRGTLTHALLEHLPSLPAHTHGQAARAFVSKRGAGLSTAAQDSIVNESLAILADPTFKALFGPASRAEVSIAATLPRPSGSGPALKLNGQIDRLVVREREVLIVDYKTNRPPPRALEQVAPAYLFQLAAYVLALGEIYPSRRVRAALLWTDGPRLMEVPDKLIQDYIRRLWDLDPGRLDGL